MAVAFSGVRRESEVPQLLGGGVRVDVKSGGVDLKVKRLNDRFGMGQVARLLAMN